MLEITKIFVTPQKEMDVKCSMVFYIPNHRDTHFFMKNMIQTISYGIMPNCDKHWTLLYQSF